MVKGKRMKAKQTKSSGLKSGNAANGKTGLQSGNDISSGGPSLLAKNGSGTAVGAGVDGKAEGGE